MDWLRENMETLVSLAFACFLLTTGTAFLVLVIALLVRTLTRGG